MQRDTSQSSHVYHESLVFSFYITNMLHMVQSSRVLFLVTGPNVSEQTYWDLCLLMDGLWIWEWVPPCDDGPLMTVMWKSGVFFFVYQISYKTWNHSTYQFKMDKNSCIIFFSYFSCYVLVHFFHSSHCVIVQNDCCSFFQFVHLFFVAAQYHNGSVVYQLWRRVKVINC